MSNNSLGDMLGGLVGQFTGGQAAPSGAPGGLGAVGPLLQVAMSMLSNHPGGLAGLVQQFSQGGLAEHMQSWIGSGPNLPVSADQLRSVLGSGQITQMAEQAGLHPDQLTEGLSHLLPGIINHLTPDGSIPAEVPGQLPDSALTGELSDVLGKLGGLLGSR